jgi:exodeoxyribonuclease VII large subunit
LINPRKKIEDLKLKLDDTNSRFIRIFFNNLSQTRERFTWRIDKFKANGPLPHINKFKESVEVINYNLFKSIRLYIIKKITLLREFTISLDALSPLKILDRGYSITRTIPEKKIIKDPKILKIGQYLEIIVSKGQFISKVERKNQNGKTEF